MISKKNSNKKLIKKSYENFPLWSSLYLRKLMPDLASIYHFCRTVDNLSDLKKDTAMKELEKIEGSLNGCYRGILSKDNDLFYLKKTINKYNLPKEDFQKLIKSNYQDLTKKRYKNFKELINYCELSANPVGSIVLKIFGEFSDDNLKLSDRICTGLQLINFIQDISRDSKFNRIYMPIDDMKKFGTNEKDILNKNPTEELINMIKFQCERSRDMINSGKPLVANLPGSKKIPISLFIQSGNLVLKKIEKLNYKTVISRPFTTKFDKSLLISKTLIKYFLNKKLI
ncbi:MAG: squalene/phytoene synthase family protein [Dehalococcoidia bacterium]|tara:strand:- start:1208 stop:2062 length:855 start_codon:yes stop_codon:yes gene_type:complete